MMNNKKEIENLSKYLIVKCSDLLKHAYDVEASYSLLKPLVNDLYKYNEAGKKYLMLSKANKEEGINTYIFENENYRLVLNSSLNNDSISVTNKDLDLNFTYKEFNYDLYYNFYKNKEILIVELLNYFHIAVDNSIFINKMLYKLTTDKYLSSSSPKENDPIEITNLVKQFNDEHQFLISLSLSSNDLIIFAKECIFNSENKMFLNYQDSLKIIDNKYTLGGLLKNTDMRKNNYDSISELIEKKKLFDKLSGIKKSSTKSSIMKV